uniref:G-patch domain-containing protein n=1 Tax=Trichuris muris TaxID=70415 RepID=A0A5S6Q686_TRIMR
MALAYRSVRFVSASESAAKTSHFGESSQKPLNESGGLTGKDAREFYERTLQDPSIAVQDTALRRSLADQSVVASSNGSGVVKSPSCAIADSPFSPQSRFLKAASEGAISEMKRLMGSGAIDINFVDDFGWSALMCASYGGHLRTVAFLLRNGADASLRCRNGQSAADLASKAGHLHVQAFLAQNDVRVERRISSDATELVRCEGSSSDSPPQYCGDCDRSFRDKRHPNSTAHLVRTLKVDSKPSFSLCRSNVGYKLLVKGGWNQASGLGKCEEGKWYPLKTVLKRDRKGLGCPSAAKPRVTHFGPFDRTAVSHPKQNPPKLLRKSELDFAERRSKRIAQNFRRQFYEL